MPVTVFKISRSIFALLLPVLIFSACSNAYILRHELPKYKAEINYLHDTPINACNKSENIALVVNTDVFQDSCSFKKKRILFLPLIFYFHASAKLEMHLGQSSLKRPLNKFYATAFQDEAKRNGCFNFVDTNSKIKPHYQLTVKVDSVSVKANYVRKKNAIYVFFGILTFTGEVGHDADATLWLTVKLTKDNQEVFWKPMIIHKTTKIPQSNAFDIDVLREDFVTNMAESLGMCIKESIETTIPLVNAAIKAH